MGGQTNIALGLVLLGDSLTERWGVSLGAVLERPVFNTGVGGQTSSQVAARQGGAPALVTIGGGVIPSSGAVTVSVSVNLFQRNGDGEMQQDGTLAGIPGTLRALKTAANGSTWQEQYEYTFTRKTPGNAAPCPANSPFQTGDENRNRIPIIGIGRNNFKSTAPEVIVEQVKSMLDWSEQGKKGIVLAVPPWTDDTPSDVVALANLNAELQNALSARFVDVPAFLRSEDTLQSVGITATTQDLSDIAAGLTPTSFRTDEGHYNNAAYQAINGLISGIILQRGY